MKLGKRMQLLSRGGAVKVSLQSGSALVEVMISLVIIAIALLSHSQMIGKSVKYSTQTAQVTQADILSREIIEDIMNNQSQVDTYALKNFDSSDTPNPECIKINATTACDNKGVALAELQDWRNRVLKVMPNAQAFIDHITGINAYIVVNIIWNPDGLASRTDASCGLSTAQSADSAGNGSENKLLCHQVKVAL